MDINLLRTDAIQILDGRQRVSVDEAHIKSLAVDILENGLIHPVTLTHDNFLVAGFCRLTAVRGITGDYRFGDSVVPRGYIPVIRLDRERTAIDLFKLEFAENEKRVGLSHIDRSAALAHLHRNLEAVATQEGRAWSKQDTAAEIVKLEGGAPAATRQNVLAGEVSDALIIDAFKDDADVAAAPSKQAAVKIAKKKLEDQFTQMLGAKVMQEKQEDSAVLNASYRVYKGDFKSFPHHVDYYNGVICDPPYGMDADEFGNQSHVGGHQYKDDEESALSTATDIFKTAFPSCKSGAHLYMFCDIRMFPKLKLKAEEAGWNVYSTPLIWQKGFGHAPQVGYFARHYECILFAAKGFTRLLTRTTGDVFAVPGVREKQHAAQKPVELVAQLMRLSFFPGERVVDYTCGSGTIFRAAAEAGLRADGFEKEEQYFNLCQQVIAGIVKSEGAVAAFDAQAFLANTDLDSDDDDDLPLDFGLHGNPDPEQE